MLDDAVGPLEDRVGAPMVEVGEDVPQAFAHPARPGGLRPPLRRIALDLRLRVRREPFHRGRVLARHHADHVALRRVGDDGDAPAAPAAGPVDADRLHARVAPRTGAPRPRNGG